MWGKAFSRGSVVRCLVRSRTLAILMLTLLVPQVTRADMAWSVVFRMGPGIMESRVHVKGHSIRIERHNLILIARLDEKTAIVADRSRRVWTSGRLTRQDLLKLSKDLMADPTTLGDALVIKPLHETRSIQTANGKPLVCELREVSLAKGPIVLHWKLCVVQDPPAEILWLKELSGDADPEWIVSIEGMINDYPVFLAVRDIDLGPVDESRFRVPDGYRRVSPRLFFQHRD